MAKSCEAAIFSRIAGFVFLWTTVVVISGCEFQLDLPGNHKLAETSGNCFVIYDSSNRDVLIGPGAVKYRVIDGYIVGSVAESTCPRPEHMIPRDRYYFIIDTEKDFLYDGLSHEQWLEAIKAQGVAKQEPELEAPSALQIFRHN